MPADPTPPDEAQPITAPQIADEIGAPRHTVSSIAARLKLGTWGQVRHGHGYVFTPEEAEQLRAVVRHYLEEQRRRRPGGSP